MLYSVCSLVGDWVRVRFCRVVLVWRLVCSICEILCLWFIRMRFICLMLKVMWYFISSRCSSLMMECVLISWCFSWLKWCILFLLLCVLCSKVLSCWCKVWFWVLRGGREGLFGCMNVLV